MIVVIMPYCKGWVVILQRMKVAKHVQLQYVIRFRSYHLPIIVLLKNRKLSLLLLLVFSRHLKRASFLCLLSFSGVGGGGGGAVFIQWLPLLSATEPMRGEEK